MSKPPPLEDGREWVSRARSDLSLARAKPDGVYLEDLCSHAKQSAEKAIKALLVWLGIKFRYVHDLAALLTLLEKSTSDVPDSIRQAERLTQFAVEMRYPGAARPVREREYQQAIKLAEEVLNWVEKQLKGAQR